MSNDLFKKVPVKVQSRSGFDKSYRNLLTTKVGTLTPLVCDELIPNTTVNMKLAISAQLPPLATDTFMKCRLRTEAFFCPTRLLMKGYEDWLTGNDVINSTNKSYVTTPVVRLSQKFAQPGSLADYLGFMVRSSPKPSADTNYGVSAFPFLAYHMIWDDWYRNSLIQKSLFADAKNAIGGKAIQYGPDSIKFVVPSTSSGYEIFAESQFANSHKFGDLHQRNFGMDYFTTATPRPQNGAAQGLKMKVEGKLGAAGSQADLNTGFSIAALRAANSMQLFLERNNLAGNRLVDYVKAHYGATLSDGVAQRSVYLGGASFDVYSKGIYQSGSGASTVSVNNPFKTVGARYGSAYAEGADFVINNFTAMEPGYIMVLVSLVPDVTYSSGIKRSLMHFVEPQSQSDMANPLLQNVGNQPIYLYELDASFGEISPNDSIFGYTDRFAEYKYNNDELHGLLRDGGTLSAFALQRNFGESADASQQFDISSEFLEIPTDYLDQVSAVKGDVSNYGVWIDSFVDLKEVMPLARYAIPTLEDPAYEHGQTVMLDRSGRHVD